MPITYTVDSDRRLIFEIWQERVCADDVREYWFRSLEDPRFTAIRRLLVDMRGAEIDLSPEELGQLINEVAAPYAKSQRWAIACVVDSRAQYELSLQYQIFIKTYSRDQIFRDRNVAVAWLSKQDLGAYVPSSIQTAPRTRTR
jgi:hypothetical protein